MTSQVLEKRTADAALYDLDLSRLLASAETVSTVTSIAAEPVTSPALTFGTGVVNVAPIVYDDHTAAAGKVVQVQISGGSIAAGTNSRDYIVRCRVATNINPAIEATVTLRLDDTPDA